MSGARNRTTLRRCRGLLCAIGAAGVACAGGAGLPTDDATDSPFRSFARAQDAFAAVVTGETTATDLAGLDIDPARQGVTVRPYADVTTVLYPHEGMTADLHPRAVGDCLAARLRCELWLLDVERIRNRRESFWLMEILQLHRVERTEGFLFTGVLLLIDDVVVYKLVSGVPTIEILRETRQPLGFLQSAPLLTLSPRFGIPPLSARVRATTTGESAATLKDLRTEEMRGSRELTNEENGI